jgi:hypothetical protein
MKRLNEEMIRARSNNFDLDSVFSLSLASLGWFIDLLLLCVRVVIWYGMVWYGVIELRALDGVINQCTSMWNLDLADNKVTYPFITYITVLILSRSL